MEGGREVAQRWERKGGQRKVGEVKQREGGEGRRDVNGAGN